MKKSLVYAQRHSLTASGSFVIDWTNDDQFLVADWHFASVPMHVREKSIELWLTVALL